MKLFTIGPVQMYENTLREKSKQVPYFRTKEFSELMYKTDRQLKKIIGAKESSEAIYLTSSGTAAMEAAVMNIFTEKDKVLVVVGGTFGRRFSEICSIHNIEHEDIILANGEVLTSELLKEYDNKGFTGFLVNLDETSTGQLYDINIIREFCRRNKLYLVIDAITTFLCDEFHMDKFGADAVIISSQKGLCLSPGLSIVVLNERLVQDRICNNAVKSMYFDFKDYIRNMKNGQTPFTPAVGIIYELADMLDYIEEKGLETHLSEIRERADYFRSQLKKIGAGVPAYPLSNAITPVIFEKPVAKIIFEELKNNFDIMVNPTGGNLEQYQLRVSHIGNLTLHDYDDLIDKILSVLNKLGG